MKMKKVEGNLTIFVELEYDRLPSCSLTLENRYRINKNFKRETLKKKTENNTEQKV